MAYQTGCPNCGSANIQFRRENQGEVRSKHSKQIIHRTVGFCKDCGYTWTPQAPQKPKSKLWLWVIGWICCFPIPLTILMLRNQKLNNKAKYGIIATGWIVFLCIGLGGRSNRSETPPTVETPTEQTTTAATAEETSELETTAETVSETETVENEPLSENTIQLTAGQKNQYSEEMILNKDTEFEEKRIVYFVPKGKYTVKNGLSNPTQVTVYLDEIQKNDDGWEEPAASDTPPILLDSNAESELEIKEHEYIYISEPTVIELTPMN